MSGDRTATLTRARTAPDEFQPGPGRPRPTQAFRLARVLVLFVLLTVLDVTDWLSKGGQARYLFLLPPMAVALGIRLGSRSRYFRRVRPSDSILFVLFAWGLIGTVYGIVFRGTKAGMLPGFLPMALGFLGLLAVEDLTEQEAAKLLRWIAAIGALYVCMNAAVNAHLVPGLAQYRQYRNALFLLVMMGVCGAYFLGRGLRLLVLLLLTGVIFVTYPSGTALLIMLGTGATLWMTGRRGSRLRPYVLGAVLAGAMALALVNFNSSVNVFGAYFKAVGKSNDNANRVALWQAGIAEFKQSPIVGNSFSGGTTITAVKAPHNTLITLPFHNDYILFLTSGGLLGLGLLISWITMTEVATLRRHRRLVEAGLRARASLLRVLLVGFNGFVCAAAFNPEFAEMSRTATLFAISTLMFLVGSTRSASVPSGVPGLDGAAAGRGAGGG